MKSILIVDDEKNVRLSLRHALSDRYALEFAENGREGIDKALQGSFELLLLDINLPDTDGLQVLRELRALHFTGAVVMMTAYGTVEKAVDAMKLGALDFLSKPFSKKELLQVLAQVTERPALQEENLHSFEDILSYAKKQILSRHLDQAQRFLRQAAGACPERPEPHNLLGVLLESSGEIRTAQKHYRAALSLDPTYLPAQHNLERTVMGRYAEDADYGA